MPTLARNILGIVPGLQATSVLAMNIPKKFPTKPTKNMAPKQIKGVVKRGVGTLVGIVLIKPTATMIQGL